MHSIDLGSDRAYAKFLRAALALAESLRDNIRDDGSFVLDADMVPNLRKVLGPVVVSSAGGSKL